jgi:hypothetical protein
VGKFFASLTACQQNTDPSPLFIHFLAAHLFCRQTAIWCHTPIEARFVSIETVLWFKSGQYLPRPLTFFGDGNGITGSSFTVPPDLFYFIPAVSLS